MTMLAYTVGVTFQDASLADEWLRWLQGGHIAEVLAGGATDAEVIELDGPLRSFEVRYHFPSREAYAAGMLAGVELEAANAAHREFPDAWSSAAKKRLRAWM